MTGEPTALFLLLTAATGGLCLWQIARALWVPAETLGMPLLFCLTYLYFYVIQGYFAAATFGHLLPAWMFEFGQLVALLALIGFVAGWRWGRSRPVGRRSRPERYDDSQVFVVGVLFMVIGAFGSTMSYGGVNYKETSAYLYLSYHLGYPGALLCLQVAARRREFRNPLTLFVPLVLLGVILTPAVMQVRRGPMFPMAIVLLYGYSLTRGRRPHPLFLLAGLVGTGLLMLVFVSIRDYGREGGSWSLENQRVQTLTTSKLLTEKLQQADDNEYLGHCMVLAVCWHTGANDYGTGYLTLFTHWVPREVWPDKPALGQGFLGDNPVDYLYDVVGLGISPGAATGGVCEAYCHLGPFSLLMWVGFGYVSGRLYTRGMGGSALDQSAFIAIAATAHWLIAQGLPGAWVPGLAYFGAPWLAYSLSRQDEGEVAW